MAVPQEQLSFVEQGTSSCSVQAYPLVPSYYNILCPGQGLRIKIPGNSRPFKCFSYFFLFDQSSLLNGIPCARVAKEEVPLAQYGTPSIQIHQVQAGQSLALISYLYRWTGASSVVLINSENHYSLPEEVMETASQAIDIPLMVLKRDDGAELLWWLEEMPLLQCEVAVVSSSSFQAGLPLRQNSHFKESREKRDRLTGNLLDNHCSLA